MTMYINDCAKLLTSNIGMAVSASTVDGGMDVKEYAGAFTMDVIARTGFGIEVDSNQSTDNPFVVHSKKSMGQATIKPAVLIGCKYRVCSTR